jgi:hypothetical protein
MRNAFRFVLLAPLCGFLLAGCEQLGIEDPAKIEAAREAEGKAIGGACRHSGRALEDCYKLNGKASKAAIYAGWRDMDAYMRENNIAAVPHGTNKAVAGESLPADPAAKTGAAHGSAEQPQGEKTAAPNRKSI